jgi:hypothetical protein
MSLEDQIKYLSELLNTEAIVIRLTLDQHIAIETTIYRLQQQLISQE